MAVSRRMLLTLSAGAAAFAAGTHRASASPESIDDIRDSALRFFRERGYIETPPQDLITGDEFNGGIRYDDTNSDPGSGKTVTVQYAARPDDAAELDRPGVLAGFNLLAIHDPAPETTGTQFDTILDFLVNDQKLDPERMAFVSTEVFQPLADRNPAVKPEQVFERPLAEARSAGDGSGYFAPHGHPARPAFDTVAIYYPLPGEILGPPTSYPPAGYIEVAEIGLAPSNSGAGFGLERLAMAKGTSTPSFKDSQQELLRALEKESESRGKPLPPGYAVFAAL